MTMSISELERDTWQRFVSAYTAIQATSLDFVNMRTGKQAVLPANQHVEACAIDRARTRRPRR